MTHLLSVGSRFYGAFAAPNIPARKYFPQGVHFQRRHLNGKLLSSDGKRHVKPSIDPYSFCIQPRSESVGSTKSDRAAEFKGPALANYTGFVAAMFTDAKGRPIREAAPGDKCTLSVRFDKTAPKEWSAERIDIREGKDASEVPFKIAVDAYDIGVTPRSRLLVVALDTRAEVRFEVVAPKAAGSHSLFIQIFQTTRLVQVVAATLVVRGPGGN
jgi:hypothetical protein